VTAPGSCHCRSGLRCVGQVNAGSTWSWISWIWAARFGTRSTSRPLQALTVNGSANESRTCSQAGRLERLELLDPVFGCARDDELVDDLFGGEVQRAFGVARGERVDHRLQRVALEAVALQQGSGHRGDVERRQHPRCAAGCRSVRSDRAEHVVGDVERARVAPGLLRARVGVRDRVGDRLRRVTRMR
jgi:hypothetical protein